MINEIDRLMTITDLSAMLGVPVDTLYGWRHRGEAPEGCRIGRYVRYRRAAVEAWLDTQADRLISNPTRADSNALPWHVVRVGGRVVIYQPAVGAAEAADA
jgi:excisionase family DNA binding protein